MRILHVLSQTELTGAEVYAVTLGESQRRAGNDIVIVSDTLHIPTSLESLYQPISKRSWLQRIRNVFYLKKIIRKYGIDIVHAHSRASSWISFWATIGTRTAFVSTVHGRQHLHLSLHLYSVYGDYVIAICKNIRDHLIQEAGLRNDRISVVPNCFEFGSNGVEPSHVRRQILLVARTSGPKGQRSSYLIQNVFPRLMEKYDDLEISIAGGPLSNFNEKTIEALNKLKRQFGSRIKAREYVPRELVEKLIEQSSLIIASGRLAIKSLSRGKSVLAIGEATCDGLITDENLDNAIATNFGDILPDVIEDVNYELAEKGLEDFLISPRNSNIGLAHRVKEVYSMERVNQEISRIYFQALLRRRAPKRVPILMYHKVVGDEYNSQHKTYVSIKTFEKHLRALKTYGYSAITFEDLVQAALSGRDMPRKPIILTFDDGYRKSLQRAVPRLKHYGFRAVFYVLGDGNIKKNVWDPEDSESDLISSDEVRWLKEEGMEVGAHSMSHRKLSDLSEEDMSTEVLESKKRLELLLGTEVISFAYPYGNLCNRSKEIVKSCGFKFGLATDSGGLTFVSDLFQIFRASVFPQDGLLSILRKSSRWYRTYFALKRRKVIRLLSCSPAAINIINN